MIAWLAPRFSNEDTLDLRKPIRPDGKEQPSDKLVSQFK